MIPDINKLIEKNAILIVSGEGETGTSQAYTGKRTVRAIKMRLNKERCGGGRWAMAKVYSHSNAFGDVYADIERGKYCA